MPYDAATDLKPVCVAELNPVHMIPLNDSINNLQVPVSFRLAANPNALPDVVRDRAVGDQSLVLLRDLEAL